MNILRQYWRTIAVVAGVLVQTIVILFIVSAVAGNTTDAEIAKSRADRASLKADVTRAQTQSVKQVAAERAKVLADAQHDACDINRNTRKDSNANIRALSVMRSVLSTTLKLAARDSHRLRRSFAHQRSILDRYNFRVLALPDCAARAAQTSVTTSK